MRLIKTTLPLILAFVMGIVAIVSVFVPHHYSDMFRTENTVWFRVIGGVTMFIGAYSLLRVHYNRVKRGQKGWGYSMILFVFCAVTVLFGVINWGAMSYPSVTPKVLSQAQADKLEAELSAKAATQPDKAQSLLPLTFKGEPLTGPTGDRAYLVVAKGATGMRELKDALDKPVTMKAMHPPKKKATATTAPDVAGVTTAPDVAGVTTSPDMASAGTAPPTDDGSSMSEKEKPLYVDLGTGEVRDEPVGGVLGPLKPRSRMQEGTRWMYEAIQWPAGATQYALLGFFICSAAYRTFRAKSVEAAVLLIAALIVMLGQVPIAQMIWDKIPQVSGWLLDIPNMAVKRAIMFGICVGSVGTSLRVLFGIERSYMGSD